MTAPRMTPTNDAPVTVEQCDREAFARLDDWEPGSMGWNKIVHPTGPDCVGVVAFAKHRLAALASAPAGDGVAIGPPPQKLLGGGNALMEARIRFRSDFPPPYNTPEHIAFRYNEGTWCADNLLDDLREAQAANGCLCDFVTVDVLEIDGSALARLRGAAGERPSDHDIGIVLAWAMTGNAAGYGTGLLRPIIEKLCRLALQAPPPPPPPAKVGE